MRHFSVIALLAALVVALDAYSHVTVRIRSEKDLATIARLRFGPEPLPPLLAIRLSVEERKNDLLVIRVSASDRVALKAASVPFNEHAPRPASEVQHIIRGSANQERDTPTGSKYHNYVQMTELLQQTAAQHPSIVSQGRNIWAMRITDHPDIQEREPEVKYVGNIHGDETLGRENLIRFIHLLTSQYGADPRITRLVDSTDIYLIPSMNPDGFEAGSRYNQPLSGQGIDLNRDFPDQFDPVGTVYHHQPETQAIMNFCNAHYFVLSISFHGGDLVVNYPWDGTANKHSVYSKAPDDEVFRAISLVYSTHHPTMRTNTAFTDGITNGAKWYVLYGGMQDWNYIARGTFEVTVELAESKTPPSADLEKYYEANVESMLAYIEGVHTGVRGVVRQAGQPVAANVTVDGIAQTMYSDPAMGDFYRLLGEGTCCDMFVVDVLRARVGSVEKTRTVYVPRMQAYIYTEVTFSFD